MSDFQAQTVSPTIPAPDPFKRVKYSLGMVLGVDDLDQEYAYLSHLTQWQIRETIGYGTVCGLQVTIETDERGPRVVIDPGVAINPRGQLIRVKPAQCAYINDWLNAHRDEVLRQVGSPLASSLTLYVVLCYRSCETDPVPIPGEPCRDETSATVNSRILDDFELKLSLTAPVQTEENAVTDFGQWLRQVQISEGVTSVSLDQFIQALRDVAHLLESSPGSPPDYMYGSPPAVFQINAADACQYLKTAFRVWVTELRAHWRGPTCNGTAPAENCVLLAELNVPLVNGQAGTMAQDDVNEDRRPYLVHLRMLQEWLLCGRGAPVPGDTVVSETAFDQVADAGTASSYSRSDHTHGTPVLPTIPVPADTVTAETVFGMAANAGAVVEYSRADHTHGTPVLPPAAVPGDTVTSETNFGQVAGAGMAVEYSRTDHTHGTPALPPIPEPGNTVTFETNFGQAADPGVAMEYSRADHTHGTPGASPVSGDFVEHPAGLPKYFIEAAGIARADGSNPTPEWAPNYNGLFIEAIDASRMRVSFDTFSFPDGGFQYIIKAIPVYEPQAWEDYQIIQPIVNFEKYDDVGIVLFVTNLGKAIENPVALPQLAFVIEVSRYDA